MLEKYTKTGAKIIKLAQKEAKNLRHGSIGTEFVLLGLISDGSGLAAKILKSMGVTIENAREQVEKIIGRGSGYISSELPFTPRCAAMLKYAEKTAYDLENDYIDDVHLLLGILEEKDGIAVYVLANLNVNTTECGAMIYDSIEHGEYVPSEPYNEADFFDDELPHELLINPYFIKLMVYVQESAESFNSKYFGTEHLLDAITRNDNTLASKCLKLSNITNADIKNKIVALRKTDQGGEDDKFQYSKHLKELLKIFEKNAVENMSIFINDAYVLLNILELKECTACKILESFSVNIEKIKANINYALDNPEEYAEKRLTIFDKIRKIFTI